MKKLSLIEWIRNIIYRFGINIESMGNIICRNSDFECFNEAAYHMIVRYCKRMHRRYGISYSIYSVEYRNSSTIYIEVRDKCVSPMIKDNLYIKQDTDFRWKLEKYYGAYLWDYLDEGWSIYRESDIKNKKLLYKI